jgi:S1-C subfamily serine protease
MKTISYADELDAKEILFALSQTLSSNNGDPTLLDYVSLDNIEGATVQVYCASEDMRSTYTGTGLLLTEDGIFVTAYHIIEPYLKRQEKHPLSIVLSKGINIEINKNIYEVSDVFCWNTATDLAMCYANIPNKQCKAIKFRTLPARISYITQQVTLISIQNGKTYRQFGKITSNRRVVKLLDGKQIVEGYDTDAYSFPGFSGGPVVTMNGQLVGLCLYASTKIGEQIDNRECV